MTTQRKRRSLPARVWLRPIGVIRSMLRQRNDAPRQGSEGAPDAWLELEPWATAAVTVRRITGRRLRIGPIEVIDGTPVVDIEPGLHPAEQ